MLAAVPAQITDHVSCAFFKMFQVRSKHGVWRGQSTLPTLLIRLPEALHGQTRDQCKHTTTSVRGPAGYVLETHLQMPSIRRHTGSRARVVASWSKCGRNCLLEAAVAF